MQLWKMRQILDATLIANEAIDSRLRSCKKRVICKTLQKAMTM